MYKGYLTDISGIKVGHSEDREALTGTTAILLNKGMVCGVDVRGSGPGTRETDIFDTKKMIDRVHGICLSGGSAFGLDAASGVMKFLEEEDIGFDVGVTKVPIVTSAVLFDLLIGDYRVRPDFNMGYRAAKNASSKENRQGNIGAGTGATVGKILGPEKSMKSGLGSATVELGELKVSALVAVNAVGDIFDLEGRQIAGVYDYEAARLLNTVELMKSQQASHKNPTNTTIGVVATNAGFTKAEANKLAEMSHNAYAKVINPVHTMMDGDTIYAVSAGQLEADINLVAVMAQEAMAKAIINAIKASESVGEIKAFSDLNNNKILLDNLNE